jgi:hypothetical protein
MIQRYIWTLRKLVRISRVIKNKKNKKKRYIWTCLQVLIMVCEHFLGRIFLDLLSVVGMMKDSMID